MLLSMMNSAAPSSNDIDAIQNQTDAKVDDKKKTLNETTEELSCYKYLCLCAQTNTTVNPNSTCHKYVNETNDACGDVSKKEDATNNASAAVTEAQTGADNALNELKAYNASNDNMKALVGSIDSDIDNYTSQLETAPKVLPPIAAEANNTGAMTQEELDNNWLSFSFDSETSNTTTVTDSKTYKSALSFSAKGLFWHASGGASYSRAEQDFAQQMSAADTSISAKVLRVTFSRSWFTPSIFQIAKFQMVGSLQ